MIDLNKIIKESLKDKDLLKANLFRMVKSKLEILLNSKNRKNRNVTNEDILNVIKKEYKEIKEEIDANQKIDVPNTSLLKALSTKLTYLDVLLPQIAPLEEAIKLIQEYLSVNNNPKMGAIIGHIKKSGKNFDMRAVSDKIKEMI